MGIRSNTSKLLFILAVICAYGLAMADQSKSNVVTVGITGDCSLDEIKNLLSELEKLEDEQCTWVPGEGKSPNRLDAVVWLVTFLLLQGKGLRMRDPETDDEEED